MKSEVTKRTDTQVTLLITADETEIKHALEHTYDKYRPQVKAAGFRPGKAPDHIVAREVGDATIQSETIEHVMSHSYGDAVSAEKLAAIARPKVDIKKWVPYTVLEFEAVVDVVPPVALPDYKKIRKSLKPSKIEQSQIDEVVDDLRRRVAKRVPALRKAEVGDEVKLDFDGFKDGQAVTGASSKGYTLKLGSSTFIPGFEDNLVGMGVGDEKSFSVKFPDDYHEKSLAGQPVEFRVKVHEVTALDLPEINDSFASEVGPFKTVAELRADIEDQLKVEAEETAKRQYENELLDEIVSKAKLTVPDALVRQQLDRLKSELAQRLAGSGLSLDQYLDSQKKSTADLDKELLPEAEKRVRLALVMGQVAKDENLTVGAEEIDDEIAKLRQRYTDPSMQQELSGDQVKEDIYNHLMASKVVNTLVDYAKK